MPDLSAYRIDGPALVSFSGGRTSAFMLWHILEAHGGQLPDDVHVVFANTGKEREETLRFVHECGSRWGARIRWVEFVTTKRKAGAKGRFVEVGFNRASRKGEPLDRLIAEKQAIFSTIGGRWCTQYAKVEALVDFMEAETGLRPGAYLEAIGLRADEGRRIARLRESSRNNGRALAFPIADAGRMKSDVWRFWQSQEFDLALRPGLGNCDHCPFIGTKSRIARARLDPAGTYWWAAHEQAKGYAFGRDYSFVELLGEAARSPELIPDDDADTECGAFCGSIA